MGPYVREREGGQTRVKLAGVDPRLVAGEARDGGERRDSPSDDQKSDGGALRDAQTRAHLIGPTGDAGVAGVRRSGARGGGRSSAMCGVGLRRARRETDGPDGIRGPPEARWCHGFEQRGSGQESYAAMANGGARKCGRGATARKRAK